MARYISRAVVSAACACSRWPVVAYSVPRPRWQGLERTHAEVVGQGQGLLVGGLGRRTVRGLPMRCNVTEEAQGIRLVTALLVRTWASVGALAEGRASSRRSARSCASQTEMTECLKVRHFHCRRLRRRLREQRHSVGNAPSQA